METLWQDVRYGMRSLGKSPGVAVVAITTLALGIGANTTIFSIVDSFLFRPLPVRDPAQIVLLTVRQKNGPVRNDFAIPDFRDIRRQSGGVFSHVACAQIGLDGLSVDDRADRIVTAYVSGDYFTMLGLRPAAGRLLLPAECLCRSAGGRKSGHSARRGRRTSQPDTRRWSPYRAEDTPAGGTARRYRGSFRALRPPP